MMQNKLGYVKCNYFFEFISLFALFISYFLFVYQSFINFYFVNNYISKDLIAERFLYERFCDEIYFNIRSYPFTEVIKTNNTNEANLKLEVKLDTYFDCQGVNNGLLNEKECQNKIVSNLTCCRSECCKRTSESFTCNNYNFEIKRPNFYESILSYNDEERIEDPRRRFCKYFNKYSNSTSILLNQYYKVINFSKNYEELYLSDDKSSSYIGTEKKEDFTDCGEVDTLKNHLFVKNQVCPINYILRDGENLFFDSISSTSLGIIIRNILSEIQPDIHEWNDKYKEEDELYKITIKNFNQLINENENYYKKQDAYFYINELPDFYNYEYKINRHQKIYWYTTNYIGFKSKEDLKEFRIIFKNNIDNPLFQITRNILPSKVSAALGIIFMALSFISIFLLIFFIKVNSKKINIFFLIKDLIILITFVAWLIIYIIYTNIKYKSININIDNHYKEIFDLYNNRRKQKYFLASIIIMAFIIIYEIYFIFFSKKNFKENKNIDKGSQNSDINLEEENPQPRHINYNLGGSVRVVEFPPNNQFTSSRNLEPNLRQSHANIGQLQPLRINRNLI